MSAAVAPPTAAPVPLDRLTPATAAEVRRNVLINLGWLAVAVVALGLTLRLVNPPAPGHAPPDLLSVASYFLAVLLPAAATFAAVAFGLGAWPGVLRGRFAADTWGVDPQVVTPDRCLAAFATDPGYRLAQLRAGLVGLVGVAATFGLLELGRRAGLDQPPATNWFIPVFANVVLAAALAGRAHLIRRAAAG